MKIERTIGTDEVALIHIARMDDDPRHMVEFVDATDGGMPRDEKWVINVSTQFGCPVSCAMCDAGSHYFGNLEADEILRQVRYVLESRGVRGAVPTGKLKVHFSRMGEPALNPAVLDAIERLPEAARCRNLIPAVATVGPKGCEDFFRRLKEVKDRLYPNGRFQLQFSVNSTDEGFRSMLMPYPILKMEELSALGREFFNPGDRKVVLNLAVAKETPLDPVVISDIFDPDAFIVKLTPLNPTASARRSGLVTRVSAEEPGGVDDAKTALEELGFDVIVSIGSPLEDEIGSNCGEAVLDWREHLATLND